MCAGVLMLYLQLYYHLRYFKSSVSCSGTSELSSFGPRSTLGLQLVRIGSSTLPASWGRCSHTSSAAYTTCPAPLRQSPPQRIIVPPFATPLSSAGNRGCRSTLQDDALPGFQPTRLGGHRCRRRTNRATQVDEAMSSFLLVVTTTPSRFASSIEQ